MVWANVWMKTFHTTELFGIDLGFWMSMGISAFVAVLLIVVFWSMKPYDDKKKTLL